MVFRTCLAIKIIINRSLRLCKIGMEMIMCVVAENFIKCLVILVLFLFVFFFPYSYLVLQS